MKEFSFLLNYDELVSYLRKPDEEIHGLEILERFGKYVDSLTPSILDSMVYLLYGKWPTVNSIVAKRRGIKRAIQTRYYTKVYGHEIPQNVLNNDTKCAAELMLKEEKTLQEQPKMNQDDQNDQNDQKSTDSAESPKEKIQKPKSKFSQKIHDMKLDEVIIWAKKEGITEEQIGKHKGKAVGLAKMNISNMLRNKLIKAGKYE